MTDTIPSPPVHAGTSSNPNSPSNATTKRKNSKQSEEGRTFLCELTEFLQSRGQSLFRIPTLGHKELDLEQLYNEVTARGGVQAVIDNKQWHNVVRALKLPSTCTNAAYALRVHYMKFLKDYENEYFKSRPKKAYEDSDSVVDDELTESDSDSSTGTATSSSVHVSSRRRSTEIDYDSSSSERSKRKNITTRRNSRTSPKSEQLANKLHTVSGVKKNTRKMAQQRKNLNVDELERQCATQVFSLSQHKPKKQRIDKIEYQYHANGVVSVTVDESFDDEFELDEFIESEDEDEEMIDLNEEIIIVSDEIFASNLSGLSGKTDISRTAITSILNQHGSACTIFSLDPTTMRDDQKKEWNEETSRRLSPDAVTDWQQYLSSLSIEDLRKIRRYYNVTSVTSSSTKEDLIPALTEYFSNVEVELDEFHQILLCT